MTDLSDRESLEDSVRRELDQDQAIQGLSQAIHDRQQARTDFDHVAAGAEHHDDAAAFSAGDERRVDGPS